MNYQLPIPRRITKQVGLPLALIVVFALLTTAMLFVGFSTGPASFLLALIPVAIIVLAAAMAYMWLDRWEPEPRRLLLGAFLWGGGVAAGISLLLNTVTAWWVWPNDMWALAVGAPLFEETTKGLFLVLMLSGKRLRELNSLTDALVYAGMVGLGFAFVEDMLYFANSENFQQGIVLFVFRMLLGVFAHPLFTSMTAIGVWFASKSPSTGLGWLWILSGWLAAMLTHGVWNGSTLLLDGLGFFIAYAAILVPVFAGVVVMAVLARRNEGRQVVAQLPVMVREGTVDHHEALWLGSLDQRKLRRKTAGHVAGKRGKQLFGQFVDAVTELALLRTRMAKRQPTSREWTEHQRLVSLVAEDRQLALPVMVQVHNQLSNSNPDPSRHR